MSTVNCRAQISLWNKGFEYFKNNDAGNAVRLFKQCDYQAKILYNIAAIYYDLNEKQKCLNYLQKVHLKDPYFAIANYFEGIVQFDLGNYETSFSCFEDALKNLRGNMLINYTMLGMPVLLRRADIKYNQGVCLTKRRLWQLAKPFFEEALSSAEIDDDCLCKVDPIAEILRSESDELLYRLVPIDNLINAKNLDLIRSQTSRIFSSMQKADDETKFNDYLGHPKLIATKNKGDTFLGFAGRLQIDCKVQQPDTGLNTAKSSTASLSSSTSPKYNLKTFIKLKITPFLSPNSNPHITPYSPRVDSLRKATSATLTGMLSPESPERPATFFCGGNIPRRKDSVFRRQHVSNDY